MQQAQQSRDPNRKSQTQMEMERRSMDSIIAYNPLPKPYTIQWDAAKSDRVWTVPAKGTADLPRYIFDKYKREMENGLVWAKIKKLVIDENERRVSKGFARLTHAEREIFENEKLLEIRQELGDIEKIVFRGVRAEYGRGQKAPKQVSGGGSIFDEGIDEIGKVDKKPTKKE